jgi:hypothetical protein
VTTTHATWPAKFQDVPTNLNHQNGLLGEGPCSDISSYFWQIQLSETWYFKNSISEQSVPRIRWNFRHITSILTTDSELD